MKTTYSILAAAAVGGMGIAQDAPARSEAVPQIAPAEQGSRKVTAMNKATTFVGTSVQNERGKRVGKVQDLVFDLEKAEIGYVVLALETGNGSSRMVPVPFRAVKISDDGRSLLLNMSEAILAAAEGVSGGEWPPSDVFAVGGPAGAETGSSSSDEVE